MLYWMFFALFAGLALLLLRRPVQHLAHWCAQQFFDWAFRTKGWVATFPRSPVAADKATFSDFMSVSGFLCTIIAIGVTWFGIHTETEKNRLDHEKYELQQTIADDQQQIDANTLRLKDLQTDKDSIKLLAPARDAQIIDSHIDRENKFNLQPYRGKGQCDLMRHTWCLFPASDPAAERSRVNPFSLDNPHSGDSRIAAKDHWTGAFLWRVIAIRPGRPATGDLQVEETRLSDWSEYSRFTIYPTLEERRRQQGVLVATSYSQDAGFSRLGESGEPEGHDIDLIRTLVSGCLVPGSGSYRSVSKRCRAAAQASPPKDPNIHFRAYATIADGLNAVLRKEADLFIGSLTRARSREHSGAVLFTPGYYPFRTRLYVKKDRFSRLDFSEWLRARPTLGVIDGSSNQWLATLLADEKDVKDRLTVATFPSFPGLEHAFDTGEVDGILVDDTLERNMADARQLDGIESVGSAWETYHQDLRYVGYPREEFAIAVASGTDHDGSCPPYGLAALLHPFARTDGVSSFYCQLCDALRDPDVQDHLLPALRQKYKLTPGS